jgi:hypothetical protein
LNRSIDGVLGTTGVSKQRPDVTVVYKDGTTVRICECVSPSQTVDATNKKLDDMVGKLDGAGKIGKKTDPIERGGKSDPTGGKANGSSVKSAIDKGWGGLF